MSRNRRNRGKQTNDLLDTLGNNDLDQSNELENDFNGSPSLDDITSGSELADVVYQSKVAFETADKPLRATLTPIDQIYPDPKQSRRAIPSRVRHQYWNGEPDFESMAHLFEMWFQEVKLERNGNSLDLDAYLTERATITERAPANFEDEDETPKFVGDQRHHPFEISLMKVIDLAASILRDGLTNPITIAPKGQMHLIETGERRWLAYHLLHWHFAKHGEKDKQFDRIYARRVQKSDLWRQAAENNARDDLNAIARARQLALLLMDLLEIHQGKKFKPFEAFGPENEQAFYAQVADGTAYRTPHGMGEKLLIATGLKNTVQLRQYRRLLRLPGLIWTIADDLDWSENFIQKMILRHGEEEFQIRETLKQAEREGYTISEINEHTYVFNDEIDTRVHKGLKEFEPILNVNVRTWLQKFDQLEYMDAEKVALYITDLAESMQRHLQERREGRR